jgi:[ribosomal protein S18]-alanine N-acetyltransferase
LLAFFSALEETNETDFFHPHPFNDEAIEQIMHRARKDLYYVLTNGEDVLGYGMLRGWDEGYAIPSLGIAIHPGARGGGLGRVLMCFLHAAARLRGSKAIRLRVRRDNDRALKLYRDLGYIFQPEEDQYLVGFLALDRLACEMRGNAQ